MYKFSIRGHDGSNRGKIIQAGTNIRFVKECFVSIQLNLESSISRMAYVYLKYLILAKPLARYLHEIDTLMSAPVIPRNSLLITVITAIANVYLSLGIPMH